MHDKAEPRSDRREFDTYEWRKVDWAAGNEPRRGASIGSLDGRRYTRPHTNVFDMFLWASQHGVKCRTTPRRVLVTHGTLCCREPLITDAESISISRSFTTCDAVYANVLRLALSRITWQLAGVRDCMRLHRSANTCVHLYDIGYGTRNAVTRVIDEFRYGLEKYFNF